MQEGDSGTRRDHLEAAAKAGSSAAQAELDAAAAADAGPAAYLWDWFMELHAARGSNGFGPSPIGFADLAAWAQLTKRAPTAFEVMALRALDHAYLEVQGNAQLARAKK